MTINFHSSGSRNFEGGGAEAVETEAVCELRDAEGLGTVGACGSPSS